MRHLLLSLFLVGCFGTPTPTSEYTPLCGDDGGMSDSAPTDGAPIDLMYMPDSSPVDGSVDAPQRRKLVAILGQSNAVGVGWVSQLSAANAYLAQPYPAVLLRSKTGDNANPPRFDTFPTGPLEPKLRTGTTRLGIELSLGRTLDAAMPNQWVIAKFAMSSTSLYANWKPTGTWPSLAPPNIYTQAVMDIADVATETNADVVAVIWIQAENDAGGSGTSAAYGIGLTDLVNALRIQFANVPFFYGRLNVNFPWAYTATVRSKQEAYATTGTNVYMLNQDSYALYPDNAHYTSDGLVELGVAYGNLILANPMP